MAAGVRGLAGGFSRAQPLWHRGRAELTAFLLISSDSVDIAGLLRDGAENRFEEGIAAATDLAFRPVREREMFQFMEEYGKQGYAVVQVALAEGSFGQSHAGEWAWLPFGNQLPGKIDFPDGEPGLRRKALGSGRFQSARPGEAETAAGSDVLELHNHHRGQRLQDIRVDFQGIRMKHGKQVCPGSSKGFRGVTP